MRSGPCPPRPTCSIRCGRRCRPATRTRSAHQPPPDPSNTPMCVAVALPLSELPVELIEHAGLSARVHDRGGEKEVRFYWRAVPALLPVWWGGRLQVVRWGNRDRVERKLPLTGW